MEKRKPRKPRTKAILPKNEHTIVDKMPDSARNDFHEQKSTNTSKRTSKKHP